MLRTADGIKTEVIARAVIAAKARTKIRPHDYAARNFHEDVAWRSVQIARAGACTYNTVLGEAITAGKQTSPTSHACENDKHRGYGNTDNAEMPTS